MNIKEMIQRRITMRRGNLRLVQMTQEQKQIVWNLENDQISCRALPAEEGAPTEPTERMQLRDVLMLRKEREKCRRQLLRTLRQLPMTTSRKEIPDERDCGQYLMCQTWGKVYYYTNTYRNRIGKVVQKPENPAFAALFEMMAPFCDFTNAAEYDCSIAPAERGEEWADPNETQWSCLCGHWNRMSSKTCSKCGRSFLREEPEQ